MEIPEFDPFELPHDARIQILNKGALRVFSEMPATIAGVIAESKYVEGDPFLDVRWTYDNVLKLAQIGYDPPSPLRHHYPWPSPPLRHQVRTVEAASVFQRFGIWNEQGLGKTYCGLTLIDYLMQRQRARRALVVCPVSVMRAAWQQDAGQFTPHLRLRIAHGTPEYRREVLADFNTDITVINYDALDRYEKEIGKGAYDIVVCDEANYVKSRSADRTKALFRLTKADDIRLILMTGTPASQSPEDAYALGRLLRNPLAPSTLTAWRDQVMTQVKRFVWVPKPDAPQRVAAILQPSIRYTKAECLDLPERTYVRVPIAPSKEQVRILDALRRDAMTMHQNQQITAQNAAVLMSKMLQVAAGVVYGDERDRIHLDVKERLQVMIDKVQGSSRKSLIFVNYSGALDMVVDALRAEGIPTEKIDGSVSMDARGTLVRRFQESPVESLKTLVIQPAAAAHGITLTAADTVLWWGPPLSVELYKQANDRPHRIGQKNPVTIYQLEGAPIETKMWKALERNIDVHHAAVELFNELVFGV